MRCGKSGIYQAMHVSYPGATEHVKNGYVLKRRILYNENFYYVFICLRFDFVIYLLMANMHV